MKYAFTLAALVAAVSAQSPVGAYGQCGGSPWTGSTTCVAGYYCNAYSQWYSQCIPGTASSVKTTTTTTTSKPASSTTTKPPSSTTVVTTTVKPSSTTVVTTTKPVTTTAVSSTTTSASATAVPSGSISYASGTSFVIDGKKQYFAGTNSYWIGFLTNNADIDLVMSHLAESGEKVLRVWGFNDVTSIPSADTVYYQSFINGVASINTGPNGLQRLDYVVKSAEAHGIKLIINFVNNWKDYGGMAAYFSYAGISSNQEWYVSAKAQAQYQAYIKAVVSRYPNSPAIFAWELSNEARCNGCATTVLANWVAKTAAYIKSLDSKHMVTTGEEGMGLPGDGSYPYQYGEGGNFTATCSDPNIDFCTYHLYPDSWTVGPAKEWGNAWIQAHAKICVALNKPCVLEEFGQMNTCASELAWEMTALNTPGTGGDMFWQYGDTLSWGQTSQDGNTVYYKDALWQCLVAPHIADVMAKNGGA